MTEAAGSYRYPYTPTPGASTPPASTPPEEGIKDLWGFFWLSLVNTTIIALAGIATWYVVH